jgi:haloalkane dehalogenase
MQVLRTPDDRFTGLPDFPYEARYVDVDAGDGSGPLRMAYVDEGPRDGCTVLMLHGEPSWSFLYRKIIPIVVEAGHRAIAPDLIGFGRSDKPVDRDDYTYARHVAWVTAFLDAVELDDITLLCQDWGGLIGLRLVAAQPDRFAGVVAANTFLPDGTATPSKAFLDWQRFSQTVEEFPTGFILQGATTTELSDAEVAAYEAPFPDQSYVAGARAFPALVPTSPDDPGAIANAEAWRALEQFDKPFVTAFSDSDPVTGGADAALRRCIPGAQGQPHTTLVGGHHFLQEDVGPELAQVVVDLVGRYPS